MSGGPGPMSGGPGASGGWPPPAVHEPVPTAPALAPEAAEADQEEGDRLSRLLTVLIAFAALVAAVAGYLQSTAAATANDARLAAEQHGLDALGSVQSSQQRAHVEIETWVRALEQRTEAANAAARAIGSGDSADDRGLQEERERWEALAAATEALTAISADGEDGPLRDPAFPTRFLARALEEATRLNAVQDGVNEEAGRHEERAAAYTAVLAMLAVSLYLLGLSLGSTETLLRRGYLAVALVLLVTATGWAGIVALGPAPTSGTEAADEYAAGTIAMLTAYDADDYRAAEAHFSRAIDLRPTFARAFRDRAVATFYANLPERSVASSIVPPEALDRSRRDLDRARELGLETPVTLGSLGFHAFLQAIQQNDGRLLDESARFSREAIALDPDEPLWHYNLGVALAADGRLDEATAAYREAIARTIWVDAARTEPRGNPGAEEAYVAGALTDLEIVLARRPDLGDAIRRLKELIVGAVTNGGFDPAPSPATFRDLRVDWYPAELQWVAHIDDYDPARDTISMQWYYDDPSHLGWAVMPAISGAYRLQPSGDAEDGYHRLVSYLSATSPPECLPEGRFRVELYVNGRLAAQGETASGGAALDAFTARDLGVAGCRPADWVPEADEQPGLLRGFESPDGSRGVHVIRYALPGSVSEAEGSTERFLDTSLTTFASRFPAAPTYDEASGTTDDYFLGLESTAWRWYTYEGGYVRAAAGRTADGSLIVALVHGPTEWFDTGEPSSVVTSLVPYE